MGRSHRTRKSKTHTKGSYGKRRIKKHKGTSKRRNSVNNKNRFKLDHLYEEQVDG